MKLPVLFFVLFQLVCSATCLTNNINLTIYNNLNYTIAISDIVYNGNCENCQSVLVEPCKSTNLYVTTKLLFMDVTLSYKVFRHYYGKPNNLNNVRLKDALYSNYDLIPHKQECLNEVLKFKRSLVIRRNAQTEKTSLCLDRFIDISDEIEYTKCDFGAFDNV